MDFGRNLNPKENANRRERQDLILLSREMEMRHQQMRRLLETSRVRPGHIPSSAI